MTGIVFACMAPHGEEVIGPIAGPMYAQFEKTRKGMERLSSQIAMAEVDTIVLATPHGFRVKGLTAVATSSFAAGNLTKNGQTVRVEMTCDRAMALQIVDAAKAANLPLTAVTFGSESGFWSVLPLDWGSVIPLWFLGANATKQPEVVIITPTRDGDIHELVALGQLIARIASDSGKRVAFVASADQGHAHDPDGPYGYDPASAQYDDMVASAIRENRLETLFKLDASFIDAAKPDSLWQIAILFGVLQTGKYSGQLISYDVPTYYGLMCAAWEPDDGGRQNDRHENH